MHLSEGKKGEGGSNEEQYMRKAPFVCHLFAIVFCPFALTSKGKAPQLNRSCAHTMETDESRTVCFSNLPPTVGDSELRALLEQAGHLESLRIRRNDQKGQDTVRVLRLH